MVQISPFRAIRPRADKAADIISVPYDVVNTEEARALAENRPQSFLRVVRSEIEFPPGTNPYGEEIYDRARDNLEKLISSGAMEQEGEACLYVYRLNMGEHQQTGLVARAHAADYAADKIKKHEFTRQEKEQDRTKHVDHLGANTGPVFLMYRSGRVPEITPLLDKIADQGTPIYDITRDDKVRHRVYRISPGDQLDQLVEYFGRLDALYIADGHHRAASAANVCNLRKDRAGSATGDEPFNWFLTVAFPDEQLDILAYNRAVQDLNGLTKDQLMEKLGAKFRITSGKTELKPRTFNMFVAGEWHHLVADESLYKDADEVDSLDVSILQNHVLAPLLGIDDPRTSSRIKFVGGIRGDQELERLVNGPEFEVAFSLYATSPEELLRIADAGRVMPPKSTWFEPKLASGFLVNKLED